MKRIVITGGLGFIGNHLLKKLLEQKNLKITVIDIKLNENVKSSFRLSEIINNPSLKNSSKYTANDNEISFFNQDIRHKEDIFDIFKNGKFDTCIHLAAKVSVVDSILNPEDTFSVNEYGTLNILEACAKNRVENFIFASSAAVYGKPKILPISEDYVMEPLSPYGASKVAGEASLCSYVFCGKIKKGITLRLFNGYGEGQNPEYSGVITKFAENLSKGLPLVIYGNGRQTRDFIYVGDIVKAIIFAARSKDITRGYHTFNVATGKATSINDLASIMMKIFGQNIKPILEDDRSGEIKNSSSDISKAKKFLNFEAKIGLESGLTILKKFLEKNSMLRVN